MNFLKLLLLLTLSGLMAACAESADTSDYPPPEQVPTHDDGHGWGANVQGLSGR
jgi:hypothetical protein